MRYKLTKGTEEPNPSGDWRDDERDPDSGGFGQRGRQEIKIVISENEEVGDEQKETNERHQIRSQPPRTYLASSGRNKTKFKVG